MKKELVTLAKPWDESIDPTRYWLSEKLDGVRALYNPLTRKFTTRNGNTYNAPPEWLKGMPQTGPTLDGELYAGRGKFQKCVSIVRKIEPDVMEWAMIRFMCFDVVDTRYDWFERFRINPTPCCIPVQHFYCNDLEYMLSMYDQIIEQGGEGLMLRNPNVVYEFCRTSNLLKVKPELELECVVVGHTAGQGKHAGFVGALECMYHDTVKDTTVEFNVGSGLTDADRTEKYVPKAGTKIKIAYQCLTDAGIPRFPRFKERV